MKHASHASHASHAQTMAWAKAVPATRRVARTSGTRAIRAKTISIAAVQFPGRACQPACNGSGATPPFYSPPTPKVCGIPQTSDVDHGDVDARRSPANVDHVEYTDVAAAADDPGCAGFASKP